MSNEVHKHQCKRCDYEWESAKASPKACPYCKSYKWNEPKLRKES